MRKIQKRFFGLLLACMMVCLPAAQAMAAVSYDVSAGAADEILFPGDKLINAALPVMMDGAEVALDTPGTWTNTDEAQVFRAGMTEDGTAITLSPAGYVLVTENGRSGKKDDTSNHYVFQEGEIAEGESKDIAFYPAGDTVKIKADDPAEGMAFAGWTAEPGDVVFEDASSPETTITMPEKKVTVKATYQEAQPETPAVYNVTVAQGEGTGSYEAGAQVNVSAADRTAEGLEFTGWTVEPAEAAVADMDLSAAQMTFMMPESDMTLTANYEQVQTEPQTPEAPQMYTVTVADGVLADGMQTGSYEAGAWVVATANDRTAEGLEFTGWTIEPAEVALDNPVAAQAGFTMPQGDVTLTANYAEPETQAPAESEQPETQAPAESEQPETQAPTESEQAEPAVYGVTVMDGSGAGTYEAGTQVSVSANDRTAEGLVFDSWSVDSLNVELPDLKASSVTFTMPEGEVSLTAHYEAVQETEAPQSDTTSDQSESQAPLTYTVTVTGGTLNDGSGKTAYAKGETVAVKASVADGTKFTGWSGTDASGAQIAFADSTNPETTFTMPESAVTITANFVSVYSVSVKDGVLADGQTSGVYAEGDTVSVKANAAADGTKFTGWSGVIQSTGGAVAFADASQAETSFVMPASKVDLTAVYETVIPTHRVTVANGTINGSSTDVTVDQGTQVTVTANPNPAGQAFAGWKITDASGNAVDPAALGIDANSSSVTVTVSQALNFQAQYEGIEYKIHVKNGTADYTLAVSSTTVTITADDAPEGKEFDYWEVKSGNATLKDAYSEITTFTMPTAEVTVKAHYKNKEYRLDVTNGYSDYEFYKMGDKAKVSSDYPAGGKEFKEWVAVSGNVTFEDASRWQTTFTMPGSDVAVKATYQDGPSADNNAILDIKSGGEYYTGDAIKFTASGAGMDNSNPNPGDYRYCPSGYQIGNVTGSWKASPYTTTMAIKASGEYTLKVTFNKQVYDGSNWVSDGTTDTKSVTFRVVPKAAGVATGDNTPVIAIAVIAGVSCLIFIALLVVFIKRRRK